MIISQEERLQIQHEQWEKARRDQASFEPDWTDSGERKGLRAAVHDLCELLGISLSAAEEAQIQGMNIEALTTLRTYLKRHRAWPT